MQWPWQKKKEGMDDGSAMVRMYDFATKRTHRIPAAELAPGMMSAQVAGVEGTVWVDSSQLQMHAYQHPPFSDDVRDVLRQIQSALSEVYPLSLEQWEDGFRRDTNPTPEIAHWLHLSRVYTDLVTSGRVASENFAERRAIFKLLTACGIAPPAQVLSITDYQTLTRADAEAVIAAFYPDSDGPPPRSSLTVG